MTEGYSNPTTDLVYVTSSILIENVSFRLLDINGRTINQGQLKRNESLSLEDLTTGLYFLSLSSGNFVHTERLMKK